MESASTGASSMVTMLVMFFALAALIFGGLIFFSHQSKQKELRIKQSNVDLQIPPFELKEGWYPTPDESQERFFDGKEWTEEYRTLPKDPLPPVEPPKES